MEKIYSSSQKVMCFRDKVVVTVEFNSIRTDMMPEAIAFAREAFEEVMKSFIEKRP